MQKVHLWRLQDNGDGKYSTELISVHDMPSQNILQSGWGITSGVYNGKEALFATDGTDKISVIDPETWTHIKTITVKDKRGKPIKNLNELEIIKTNWATEAFMFANEWLTDYIHMIDLKTGVVVKTWDLRELSLFVGEKN